MGQDDFRQLLKPRLLWGAAPLMAAIILVVSLRIRTGQSAAEAASLKADELPDSGADASPSWDR